MLDKTKHDIPWYIASFMITGFVALYVVSMAALMDNVDLGPLSFLLIWGKPFAAICCFLPAVGFFGFSTVMHVRALFGGLFVKNGISYWRVVLSVVVVGLNIYIFTKALEFVTQNIS